MDEAEFSHISHNVQYLTPEGFKNLQSELETLLSEKRAEIAERLRESKEHGEFAEDNSELDEVKNEQAMVESRIIELRELFATAQMLEPSMVPTNKVGIGSYVTLTDPDKKNDFEIRVVASIESDPDNDLVSVEAPLGQAVYGRKVGEVVKFHAPAGHIEYSVKKIRK